MYVYVRLDVNSSAILKPTILLLIYARLKDKN